MCHVRISPVQVVWRCAVGDCHAGGAALPGSVKRTSAALRHGRRPAGEAAELPRHAVRHPAHPHLDLSSCPFLFLCPSQPQGGSATRGQVGH